MRCYDCQGSGRREVWKRGIPITISCLRCHGTGHAP